jgi:hypothetical protein
VVLKTLSGPGWAISSFTQLIVSKSPISIWEKFGRSVELSEDMLKDITREFDSSVKWQSKLHTIS